MASAPTSQDLFSAGVRELIILPTQFDKAIAETPGSDVNVTLQASAAMGDEVVRYVITRLNALSISNARGEDLDRRVLDLFPDLPRQEAQAAVVTLEFQRTSDTGLTIPAGSRVGTATNVAFSTLTDISFAEGNHGPLYVVASADRTGVSGNVGVGTITRILTNLGDSTVTVTNPAVAAGGVERQEDEDYKSAARAYYTTARRGTKEAVEFGAKQADGVFEALAIEDVDSLGNPVGRGQLFITDADGQANTALSERVELELLEYRGLGVPISIIPAVPQYVSVVMTGLLFEAGANTSQVLQSAANAILSVVNGLKPGAPLRRSDILGVLKQVDQLIVPDTALVEPAGDLVATTGTILKTTLAHIQLSG